MPSHRILLIDPFKNLLNAYRMILEEEGYRVEAALNLEEASSLLHRNRHSVIIMEYIYPFENTEEFIEKARKRAPEIYLLMIANALVDGATFERLFNKGVDDFIQKPYSPDWILVLIRKGLKKRELIIHLKELSECYPFHPVTHQIKEYIFNRTFFQRTCQQEIKRAKRHHHPISLILIKISDAPGESDQVERFLQELLLLIRKQTRSEDVLGRSNGEVSLLLPETDQTGCQALVKRLYHMVQSHPKFQADESLHRFRKNILFQPVNLPDPSTSFEPLSS